MRYSSREGGSVNCTGDVLKQVKVQNERGCVEEKEVAANKKRCTTNNLMSTTLQEATPKNK